MKNLFVRQYDAFGDWLSANGLIRYLIEERSYDNVYLVLEFNETRKNFVELTMYFHLLKIIIKKRKGKKNLFMLGQIRYKRRISDRGGQNHPK